MSDEDVTRLRAALDHVEQIARAALPGPWHVDQRIMHDAQGIQVKNETGLAVTWTPGFYKRGEADAAHIALNDPKHVLAVVAAHREILDYMLRVEQIRDADGNWALPVAPIDVLADAYLR